MENFNRRITAGKALRTYAQLLTAWTQRRDPAGLQSHILVVRLPVEFAEFDPLDIPTSVHQCSFSVHYNMPGSLRKDE